MAIKCVINESIGEIVWTKSDGKSVTLHVERASEPMRKYAVFHGFKQRGSDVMAIAKNRDTGLSATEDEKFEALTGIVAHIESGSESWDRPRAAGAPAVAADRKLLAETVAKGGFKLAVELDGLTIEQVRALLARPEFKAIADEIRAAQVAHINTDALLAGM